MQTIDMSRRHFLARKSESYKNLKINAHFRIYDCFDRITFKYCFVYNKIKCSQTWEEKERRICFVILCSMYKNFKTFLRLGKGNFFPFSLKEYRKIELKWTIGIRLLSGREFYSFDETLVGSFFIEVTEENWEICL